MKESLSRTINAALVACLACTIGCVASSSAKVASEQLQSAITKAKILPADTRIVCAVTDAELTASTYRIEQATGKDCKIDAMLIAKTAFETDPDLSRTTVQFYDIRDPNTYYEVTVTVGDVVAYGAGKVSQEQILSALKVVKQTAAPVTSKSTSSTPPASASDSQIKDAQPTETTTTTSTATGTTPTSAPSETSSTPVSIASIAPKSASTNTPAVKTSTSSHSTSVSDLAKYSNYGVTLNYPRTWRIDSPRAGSTLIRFYVPGKAEVPSTIVMQVYPRTSATPESIVAADARDTFDEDRRQMWIFTTPQMFRAALDRSDATWRAEDAKMYHYFMNRGEPSKYTAWKAVRRNAWSRLIPTAIPASIKIGPSKSIATVQRGQWIDEPQVSVRNYTRAVAFSASNFTILLGLFSPQANASTADKQFDDFLSAVTVTPAAAKHK